MFPWIARGRDTSGGLVGSEKWYLTMLARGGAEGNRLRAREGIKGKESVGLEKGGKVDRKQIMWLAWYEGNWCRGCS